MTSKLHAYESDDLNATIDLIATGVALNASAELGDRLNSRGQIIHHGHVKIQDIMTAARKSIAAYSNTTESNPGPVLNGVSERSFQEALMTAIASFNLRS